MPYKNKWSKWEEKELLRLIHLEKKFSDWEKISKEIKALGIYKTGAKCYFKWFNDKKRKPEYVLKDKKEKRFSEEEEKKLLKLSFAFAPKWKKISYHFEERNRFDVTNHFYGIIKKTLRKSCKILRIKRATVIICKIKPRLYGSLISKEIKIDFREFKKKNFGIDEENCPEIFFFTFFEFIFLIYFNDFKEIWEKITEKEVFIIKKVLIYLIDMNLKYNTVVKMSSKKINEFLKIKNYLENFRNEIIKSLDKSFYEENMLIIGLPEETF